MATQGQRQNYVWRPNDNSTVTRTRYALEAEHWVKAVGNAQTKFKPISFGETLGTIGLVISFFFNIIWMLLYGFKSLIIWMVGPTNKVVQDTKPIRKRLTEAEIDELFGDESQLTELVDMYDE